MIKEAYAAIDLSKKYGYGNITSLTDYLSSNFMTPLLTIAGTGVGLYFLWGCYKFIFSHGDKAAVEEARQLITHSLIGLALLVAVFVVLRYVPEFLSANLGINLRIFN